MSVFNDNKKQAKLDKALKQSIDKAMRTLDIDKQSFIEFMVSEFQLYKKLEHIDKRFSKDDIEWQFENKILDFAITHIDYDNKYKRGNEIFINYSTQIILEAQVFFIDEDGLDYTKIAFEDRKIVKLFNEFWNFCNKESQDLKYYITYNYSQLEKDFASACEQCGESMYGLIDNLLISSISSKGGMSLSADCQSAQFAKTLIFEFMLELE